MCLEKIYRVKILDFKYASEYQQLNFKYYIYEIATDCEENAINEAKKNYMKGIDPLFSEELPFLLKLFLVEQRKI